MNASLDQRKSRIRSTRKYRLQREIENLTGERRRRLLKFAVMFSGWLVFACLIVFAIAMSGV